MGKREEFKSLQDVEEGEASKVPNGSNSNQMPRVWTVPDLYKYPISRNYAAGLYSLAWAQAVQNKPLGDVFVMDYNKSTDNLASKCSPSSDDNKKISDASGNTLGNKIVIDIEDDDIKADEKVDNGEKEEGELEEGEIDLDSEVMLVDSDCDGDSGKHELELRKSATDANDVVLQPKIELIRVELQTVTANEAPKSFDRVCSTLEKVLDDLRVVVAGNSIPGEDALIQLCYSAIQTVDSVFRSMSQIQKQQNRDGFSRLLGHVQIQKPLLFTVNQMSEIESMLSSLDSTTFLGAKGSDTDEEMQTSEKINQNDAYWHAQKAYQNESSNNCISEPRPATLKQNDPRPSLESLKSGTLVAKGRGLLLPLLDLHKDHDADSLPSPTRDSAPCLSVKKPLNACNGVVKSDFPCSKGAFEKGKPLMHPYETDALKAVSSYQLKFGRSSFIMNDKLPSPTPSEDGNIDTNDLGEEVSSSTSVQNTSHVHAPVLLQSAASSATQADASDSRRLVSDSINGPECSGRNISLRGSSKSRDPRLRFAQADGPACNINQRTSCLANNAPKLEQVEGILSSRKQRTAEEFAMGPLALKRQKIELSDSMTNKDKQARYGRGGWLEDHGTVGLPTPDTDSVSDKFEGDIKMMENVASFSASATPSLLPSLTVLGNEKLQVSDAINTTSLHSLLKDIVVNPGILMNMLKEQQKSVDSGKSSSEYVRSYSISSAVPAGKFAPSDSALPEERSGGIPLASAQMISMDEPKIRMKPRDPRRVLHNNTFSKGGSSVADQFKATQVNSCGQTQVGQSDKTDVPSSSVPADITRQFTKKLKNIVDIVSVSQTSTSISTNPSAAAEIPLTQPMHGNPSRVNLKKVVSASVNQQVGAVSASKEVTAGFYQSQNNWGDVEHLFEGFDEQQKAAIHKERARRIEEQKNMFTSRKLCLVLDLDHTLLNSAKFSEVDPVHDEMLRKKEDQDRGKPYRHLFRFLHMGMWTKLRPGIWNFLEKASKLFELHLYTMGNKLYATEMAKLLDPTGNLFAGRVISRGDDGDVMDGDERVHKTKDLEGVMGMESSVVIIDDSARVWPHNKLNLIVVERYTYFPCSRRQFGLQGPSLLEIDHDERPEDGTLASSLAVIERIHQIFFSHRSLDEADVRNILASEQRKILAGCRIVFSRVIPVGEVNPHTYAVWQTAEQFGAVCATQIDEHVTHVVANSLGTDKVNWALSTGRYVVHPGWVEASALLYRRANEADFAIRQ